MNRARRKRLRLTVWGWLIVLLVAGLAISAAIPSLHTVFVVLLVLGAFVVLGAFGAGGVGARTAEDRWALMLRAPRPRDPGDEATRRHRPGSD